MFGHSFYVYKIKLQPACIYTYIIHLLLPRLYIHASKSFSEKSICHMTWFSLTYLIVSWQEREEI